MKRFVLAFLFILISFKTIANDAVHVAYNISDSYAVYTLLSINSILKNNKSGSEYTFWILENNVSEKNKKLMKKYVEKRNQKINFISPHQSSLYQTYFPLIKHMYSSQYKHVSFISFMRLFIPSLLPDEVSKVLYMDADTLVMQDLKEIFQTDLKNHFFAMVEDVSPDLRRICSTDIYYNAGVILINTDKWKKNNLFEKIISSFEKNPKKYKGYGEQDLLNCLFNNDIVTLHPKWNNQIFRTLHSADMNNTGIFHYIAYEKPWNSFGSAAIFKPYKIYLHYWNSSGLRRYKYKAVYDRIKAHFQFNHWKSLKDLLKHP